MWLDNPKVELIYEMAVQNMADSQQLFPTYLQLSLQIHKYLEMHGYINFGIFKRIHPIRSNYAKSLLVYSYCCLSVGFLVKRRVQLIYMPLFSDLM